MSTFTVLDPSREAYWRAIILFGNNVASYKFALAKSLLEVAGKEKTEVSLRELSVPFAMNIAEHLQKADRQATSTSSQFLDACRDYNTGKMPLDELAQVTVVKGFNNVLDAFHVVNRNEVPLRFFEFSKNSKTIAITDELLKLKETIQYDNFPFEVEARWRLVETAWELNISTKHLQVHYDTDGEGLYILRDKLRRINITSCRNALNGYQKGKCFYCFDDISVEPQSEQLADIDHFFPFALLQVNRDINLDGIWNLVLACKRCNRGESGKSATVPNLKYLERLHRRNNFLIDSHHPLRETLMLQTGSDETARASFLRQVYQFASDYLIHRWEPVEEAEPLF